MNDILAVVDWIEHMLISSFSILVNLAGAGLRIHNECCPASSLLRSTPTCFAWETNFISFFVLRPLYRVADGAFGVVVCDDCKYGVYGAVYGHNDVYRACIIGSYDVHESS